MPGDDERIARITDPYELRRAATGRLGEAQQEVTELARLRRKVIQDLHAEGLSYAQIAEAAGLSRGRARGRGRPVLCCHRH
jgi:DNA-directed RNA polymerase specialized sigma24 family protein